MVCYLADSGHEIDNTRNRNLPFQFEVGAKEVIEGLEIAIQRISPGQQVEITIPHIYAYGVQGAPPQIPPCSTLMIRLELLRLFSSSEKR
jgi:FKBP-type peptidyl-prolyl cis-trans isomerase